MSANIVWISALTLPCLNFSVNPILNCWKIKEIRQAVKATIRVSPLLFFKLIYTGKHTQLLKKGWQGAFIT